MSNYIPLDMRFLPKKTFNNAKKLLRRMNDRTKYIELDTSSAPKHLTEMHRGITINGFVDLIDKNFYSSPVKSDELYRGKAEIRLRNNGTSILFNKATGELTDLTLPEKADSLRTRYILGQTFKILKKQLKQATVDFKKSGVVQKQVKTLPCYTEKEMENLKSLSVQIPASAPKKSFFCKIMDFITGKK